jgi:hypothetical protein
MEGGSPAIGVKYVGYLPGLKGVMSSKCPNGGGAPEEGFQPGVSDSEPRDLIPNPFRSGFNPIKKLLKNGL